MEHSDLINSLRDIDSSTKIQIINSLEKCNKNEDIKLGNMNIVVFSHAYMLRMKVGREYEKQEMIDELDEQCKKVMEYYPGYEVSDIKRNILRYFIFILEMRL